MCLKFWLKICLLTLFAVSAAPSFAATDAETAHRVVELLAKKFNPESITVTVADSRAYAEMKGAVISKIRIDTMVLDALLNRAPLPASDDASELAAMIGYSKGEIVLLKRDVNNYFKVNETSGFSNLVFDFSPHGFTANGIFSAAFIFHLKIRLSATGVLALKSDGVYLDGVSIFVEGVKQPAALTSQIVERINPLITFAEIPFKVEFKKISMNEREARMTGYPTKLAGGSTASWKKK